MDFSLRFETSDLKGYDMKMNCDTVYVAEMNSGESSARRCDHEPFAFLPTDQGNLPIKLAVKRDGPVRRTAQNIDYIVDYFMAFMLQIISLVVLNHDSQPREISMDKYKLGIDIPGKFMDVLVIDMVKFPTNHLDREEMKNEDSM